MQKKTEAGVGGGRSVCPSTKKVGQARIDSDSGQQHNYRL